MEPPIYTLPEDIRHEIILHLSPVELDVILDSAEYKYLRKGITTNKWFWNEYDRRHLEIKTMISKWDKWSRYYYDGRQHNFDNPALTIHNTDGIKEQETWYKNGLIHRSNGPAVIVYYNSGQVSIASYYDNGKRHRKNGPAHVEYYSTGNLSIVVYIKHERYHRIGSPAYLSYHADGSLVRVIYYEDGVRGVEINYN